MWPSGVRVSDMQHATLQHTTRASRVCVCVHKSKKEKRTEIKNNTHTPHQDTRYGRRNFN